MKKAKVERNLSEEIDLLDDMHSSLVDLLIDKGIITEEEYENQVKAKVKLSDVTVPSQSHTLKKR
jgi:hypothetical protein